MARLLIKNEILEDQVLPLRGDAIIVGRGQDADLPIQDKSVSRFHARLDHDGASWQVTDLGSSNGTFINESRIYDPALLSNGDELRIGSVRTTFELSSTPAPRAAAQPAADLAAPSTVAPHSGRVGGGGQGLVMAGLAVIVLALCGTAIAILLNRDQPPQDSEAGANPQAGVKDDRHDQPRVDDTPPGVSDTAPHRDDPPPSPHPRTDTGETVTTPKPANPPTPPKDQPKPQELVLKDGARHTGFVVDDRDPIFLHFRTAGRGRRVLKIGRERLATLDRKAISVDLEKVFDARLAKAGSPGDLIAVARWCEDVGLTEQRKKVAQMTVESERDHVEANAILGRYKYRGEWADRAKLEGTGCITPDGRLVGTPADIQEIRRLYLITVGRTPKRSEMLQALSEKRETTTDRLLESADHWAAWLAELLVRFLGPEDGAVLLEKYRDTAEEVADGSMSFQEVFVEIAKSDAVKVKYASNEAFARQTLLVFIGEQALDDEDLLRNAVRMINSETVPVFGERGSSREDFVDIISRQAPFFRWQIRYEAARYLGPAFKLTPRQLTRSAMRLAMSPDNFKTMRRGWLLGADYKKQMTAPRTKDTGQFVRGLVVDAFNRPPKAAEEGRLRRIAADLSLPDGMRSLLAALVARSSKLYLDAPASKKPDQWVADQFRRLLGRGPTATEASTFTEVAKGPGGHRAVVAALLQSPEYLVY
ncbi:MAG: FHA domain-containing protein [Planctomycetes bacterium]|nr:FHA domain-containing protein [Planctomycetota bacterium]